MKTNRFLSAALLVAVGSALSAAGAGTSVHLTYHWHMHQPIYWPDQHPGLNRYQYGAESLDLKTSGGNTYPGSTYNHPRNNLAGGDGEYDEVFSKEDRVNAYQGRGRDAIQTLLGYPEGGASVSYSGSLMENVNSFGKDSRLGYTPTWNAGYTQARGWTTTSTHPRADMVGMTYHHAFSPLLPRSVLEKEIGIFKQAARQTWGANPDGSDHSKGFWPIECAFSTHMIPTLVDEGYEWVIVANSHLARTCANYLDEAPRGTGGWNMDPPNRADQLGPVVPSAQWWSGTLDGRGGTFPAPFGYQAHRARHIDPDTGAASEIVIVPMADVLSYQNGFSTMGTGDIDSHIAPYNDPAQPALVLMAHDGDNAWGGGYDYYMNSVPNLMAAAAAQGYVPTTIQQFLHDHPVPAGDVVHIEDGAWVNAANDWGHPQFINWLWPPVRPSSDPGYNGGDPRTWYDLENGGWAEDWRNWAVIVAGANFCETAEQATLSGDTVELSEIRKPNAPNHAELAWHFMLGALDSGFMYYGTSLDDEVKQAIACNRAIGYAQQALSAYPGVADATPPTVFKPQRFPWNPGGAGFGPLTGYSPIGLDGNPPYDNDFHVWTLVHDVAGVDGVALFVREDLDGTNRLDSTDNETYAGGTEVGSWVEVPMTGRAIPTGNVPSNPDINFFQLPDAIADHYWARVEGYQDTLLDYYVAATDTVGNVHLSGIQHVFVGTGDGATSGPVDFSPAFPLDCDDLTVRYDPDESALSNAVALVMAYTFDAWATTQEVAMTAGSGAYAWQATVTLTEGTTEASVFFHDGAGTNDNHEGSGWSLNVFPCSSGPSSVTFDPPLPDGCEDVTIRYQPGGGVLQFASQVYLHVGRNGWQDIVAPDPAMTADGTGGWTYVYSPAAGTFAIDCAFNDGGVTWDNNNSADWHVNVVNCTNAPPPPPPPTGAVCAVTGSPSLTGDPGGQNTSSDNFDFNTSGGHAVTTAQGGFGSFGLVYVNYDESNLYVGGTDLAVGGTDKSAIFFIGVDTLTTDVTHTRDLGGPPQGLDLLANLDLVWPADLAILVADEWGDGTFPHYNLGNNYNFGQGVFGLTSPTFTSLSGAQLSQFDGTGNTPTGATDADGNRLTDRWEAAIPWSSLGATGINDLQQLTLAGVLCESTVSGSNRYLSGNYLGGSATSTAGLNTSSDYGLGDLQLTGLGVCIPMGDLDGDGLTDGFEYTYFNDPTIADADGHDDEDSHTNEEEMWLGTNPTNALSGLRITAVERQGSQVRVRWTSVGGKQYVIDSSDDPLAPGGGYAPAATATETGVTAGVETTEDFVDDAPVSGARSYRVLLDP